MGPPVDRVVISGKMFERSEICVFFVVVFGGVGRVRVRFLAGMGGEGGR